MGKLKNGVKSSQLWKIISLWILVKSSPNLAQSCHNSPKTQKTQILKTNILQMRKKSKEPVGGVYASQDWSQKKLSPKEFVFIKGTFCVNTPK